MLLGNTVHTVTIVLTQVNDKDVMLITSRSTLQPTLTHGALKLGHRTIHTHVCKSECHAQSSEGKGFVYCYAWH